MDQRTSETFKQGLADFRWILQRCYKSLILQLSCFWMFVVQDFQNSVIIYSVVEPEYTAFVIVGKEGKC